MGFSVCRLRIKPYLCRPDKFRLNDGWPGVQVPFQKINFQTMFAVVKIAGQQFKVEKEQTLYVPHLGGSPGDKVEFEEISLIDKEGKLSLGKKAKAKIHAEIIGHVLGEKVIAYKQKRRKGFHKKKGHRTHYTRIKVTSIA